MSLKTDLLAMPTPEDYGYNVSEAGGSNACGWDPLQIQQCDNNIYCTVCYACLTHQAYHGQGIDIHDGGVATLCTPCRDELSVITDIDEAITEKVKEIYDRESSRVGGRTCPVYLSRAGVSTRVTERTASGITTRWTEDIKVSAARMEA